MTDSSNVREIDLGEDFGAVVVKANGAQVKIGADGSISLPAPANDTVAKSAHEIGVREREGDHKGEIYGGIFPGDNKPIWFAEEPKPMNHYDAVELKGRALPTSAQGKYIDTIKDKGALKDIFARHSAGSSSAGYFWLAEHDMYDARYQQFSVGSQKDDSVFGYRSHPLPVLSVRR
jgi:hypothetical protein